MQTRPRYPTRVSDQGTVVVAQASHASPAGPFLDPATARRDCKYVNESPARAWNADPCRNMPDADVGRRDHRLREPPMPGPYPADPGPRICCGGICYIETRLGQRGPAGTRGRPR